MKLDLSQFIFIDQHAHLLLKRHQELDALAFRKCLSESRFLSQLENHLPETVFYRNLIARLSKRFSAKGEEDFLEKRLKISQGKYIKELFDHVGIGGIICDTGFGQKDPKELTSANELADLSGRPVWQALRIESVLEECIASTHSFSELADLFSARLSQQGETKTVALKTICAYRGGLEIEPVSKAEAEKNFDQVKSSLSDGRQKGIYHSPLYHYFLWQAFELAACLKLPVQVHSGIGDDDADLRLSNPLYMQGLLRSQMLAQTNFVFLHCYPYVREAGFLCALYPHVYMDLSLTCLQVAPAFPDLLFEALSVAPATKIIAGTDGHSVCESYWYGASVWRNGLELALSKMIDCQMLSEQEAMSIAELILHENARRLYNLEGLF